MTGRGVFVRAALLACAVACAQAAHARQMPEASAQLDGDGRWVNGVTESWWMDEGITKEDAAAAAARWKEIGDGLAGVEVWTGDYFRGSETHGTYMRWSPRGGFVIAVVDKCRAAVMGLTYGRVEAAPTLVQFFPELDKRPAGGHGRHGGAAQPAAAPREVIRYVPVVWRGERLLVAESEMGDFGDYVSGLGDYNGSGDYVFLEYTAFFTRSGKGVGGVAARPVVPPGYERFIKKPIEARVTAVGRRTFKKDYSVESKTSSWAFARASLTPVTINAGAEQGVKEGMLFRASRPGESETVVVLRAGRRTSTAAVVRNIDERGRETFQDQQFNERRHSRIVRGLRLTTSPYN